MKIVKAIITSTAILLSLSAHADQCEGLEEAAMSGPLIEKLCKERKSIVDSFASSVSGPRKTITLKQSSFKPEYKQMAEQCLNKAKEVNPDVTKETASLKLERYFPGQTVCTITFSTQRKPELIVPFVSGMVEDGKGASE